MKRFLLFLFFISLSTQLFSQQYGNEWIDPTYNQQYFKIKIAKNGVYRLNYNTLMNAGFPVGIGAIADPRQFQIFNKGVEQYIYVQHEDSGTFKDDDFIEFYGEKNTGWYDTALYHVPGSQINEEYSLFTDTATYFLTYNSSQNNRRMIIESANDFSNFSASQYYFKVSRQNYNNKYFSGPPSYGVLSNEEYTDGEGWFDYEINNQNPNVTKIITSLNAYTAGPDAEIDFTVIGASGGNNFQHHLAINFAGLSVDTLFEGYITKKFHYSIPPSFLQSPNTTFNFSKISNTDDRTTISHISIKYPHTFDLAGDSTERMFVPNSNLVKSYVHITNATINSYDSVRIYDLTNHRRIKVYKNGSNLDALIPDPLNSGEKECYLTTEYQIQYISSITPVNSDPDNLGKFINYGAAVTLNSNYIIVTDRRLWDKALEYRDYRNSTGYNSLLVDVDQLYDQFSYGIRKNPMAIRNYIRFAAAHYTDSIQGLFLLGKSYHAGSDGLDCYRHNQTFYNNTIVPSFGSPPSDILFTSGISENSLTPLVPTGRLAARTLNDVNFYLSKVMDYEFAQQTPEEWMKNVLHFGGGSDAGMQSTIFNYLENFRTIIEDTLFGGHVTSFWKTSTDPMVEIPSDTLREIIKNGVSLMTFFGHAAGTGFDQSTDLPSDYQNYKKYPIIIANSCLAGDVFGDGISSSEAFVLEPNKAAIGFLASVTQGYSSSLNVYSSELYKNISVYNYGKSFGNCIKNTIKIAQNVTNDPYIKNTCLSMNFHGDPVLIVNSQSKPDYTLNTNSISFNPSIISTELESDSFTVNIIAKNIGRAINDSITVSLTRTYPDQTTKIYYKNIKAPYFSKLVAFKLPIDKGIGVGLNKIKVWLDAPPFSHVDEMSETNNYTEVNLFIKSGDIMPVYPAKYAIIPSQGVVLKASTGDPFAPAKNYIFQIDTTDLFNSPLRLSQIINHAGGVVTWTPPLTLTDSTVYYWRTSPDTTTTGNLGVWKESSFQYIHGKRGWGQAHYFQFKNDNYEYVTYNRAGRRFDFVNDFKSIYCQNGFTPPLQVYDQFYSINGTSQYTSAWMGPSVGGMIVAVFDSVSGLPWEFHVGNYPGAANEFQTSLPAGRDSLRKFLISIPFGNWVLAYSNGIHNIPSFGEPLYLCFDSIGSNYIRTVANNQAYIVFGQKRNPPEAQNETIGTNQLDIIQLKDSIKTKWVQGYVESEVIGPASRWDSLHWRSKPYMGFQTDSIKLSIIGIKLNGDTSTIRSGIPPDSMNIFIRNDVDANIYPYLKLRAYMRDDSLHTPPQLQRWQVIYEGVPETALDPSIHYYFYKEPLQEGDNLKFCTAIHNIGDYDMDSLLISYWILDKNKNSHFVEYKKHRNHPVGDVLLDTISFSTLGITGLNSLWIEANPKDTSTGYYDQLEQYHFNNIGEIYFNVDADKTNPILDVTFDGVRILNNDIVSAKPEILIQLNDENKFLALDDTSLFKVYIQEPNQYNPKRIYFKENGQEKMIYTPATLPKNSFKIQYNATFPEDGIYQLIVKAKDVSKNISGEIDYKINFEVINRSTITEVLNWPNPFSTATHFVFTLTGSEIPSYFKIQIMTVTGKVVREIGGEELGNIHVGRNITDYAWDGKDQYGDQLANGVYLYRVITTLNGEKIEKRSTSADKYFKKEFGKMFLMR